MASIKKTAPEKGAPALTRIYAWFSGLVSEDLDLLEDLLAHGVPIDVSHPLRHTTALMEATRLGRTTVVEWLLARGAAPAFLCGNPAGTPLHTALRRRNLPLAGTLMGAMETAAVIDAYGCTPLHILCMEPHAPEDSYEVLQCAQRLLAKNCPLDALDHEGITALHHCVINDALLLADVLLTHGAKADALIPDTWVSPLTIAALEKNMHMAHLLLNNGADPHLKTREGTNALMIFPDIAQIIS